MALNTVEDRVVLSFEDDLTNPSKRARGAYDREMKSMEDAAKSVAGGVGFIKSALVSLVTILSLRELKKVFNTLVGFVREHETAMTDSVARMDKAWNAVMTGIVNSSAFKSAIKFITDALNFTAVIIQNQSAWDALLDYMKAKFNLFVFGVHKDFLSMFNPFADESAFDMSDPKTVQLIFKVRETLAELKKQVKAGIADLKYSMPIAEAAADSKPWLKGFAMQNADKGLMTSASRMFEIPKFQEKFVPTGLGAGAGTVVSQNEKLLAEYEAATKAAAANRQLAEARFQADQSLANAIPLMDLVPSKLQIMTGMMQTFVSGMVNGMAAFGAAFVNGGSKIKAFGGAFLTTLGQIAIQLGTFMILAGTAKQTMPEIFGFTGGAAVAAGTALVVFGGVLSAAGAALSRGKTSGGGGGGSGDYSPSQDYGSRDYNQRQGSTNVTVLIQQGALQLLDSSQLTDKRMRELAYNFGMSFSKQTKNLDRGNY